MQHIQMRYKKLPGKKYIRTVGIYANWLLNELWALSSIFIEIRCHLGVLNSYMHSVCHVRSSTTPRSGRKFAHEIPNASRYRWCAAAAVIDWLLKNVYTRQECFTLNFCMELEFMAQLPSCTTYCWYSCYMWSTLPTDIHCHTLNVDIGRCPGTGGGVWHWTRLCANW